MTQATIGFYRIAEATTRGNGLECHLVPGAFIHITETETGRPAKIYLDPQLTKPIPNSTVTADPNGVYFYYIPLNYMVTENISSAGIGKSSIPNIGINGPFVLSLTTTEQASDTLLLPAIPPAIHVCFTPTNEIAAAMTRVYVSKESNKIVIYHPSIAGATFDLIVTPY
jgi:hypothetical protein